MMPERKSWGETKRQRKLKAHHRLFQSKTAHFQGRRLQLQQRRQLSCFLETEGIIKLFPNQFAFSCSQQLISQSQRKGCLNLFSRQLSSDLGLNSVRKFPCSFDLSAVFSDHNGSFSLFCFFSFIISEICLFISDRFAFRSLSFYFVVLDLFSPLLFFGK